jgi:energy-coupling factor transport system permease protein
MSTAAIEAGEAAAATASRPFDPYAPSPPAPAWRFLHGIGPLAKIAGPLPAMIALVLVRDLATPAAFLLLGYAVLLIGARLSGWMLSALLLGVPAFLVLVGFGFALWTDPSRIATDVVALRIGGFVLYGAALEIGFATALRLGAILVLALIGGLTTTGPDLTRALVQQLRVPYRIGYTALAALRFVPRFGRELEVIRAAHRVRGAAQGRGPIAAVRRRLGYVVPLLAGAIRHAERVALAMDARAFGAHPQRTERHVVPWRVRDTVFVAAFWSVSAALFAVLRPWG